MKKWKISVVVLFCIYSFFFSQRKDHAQALKSVPLEEQYFLEAFFRDLISKDSGCYVLFGDKPAAMMSYLENDNPSNLHLFRSWGLFDFSPCKKGFEIWQKYQYLFPSKKYAIIKIKGRIISDMGSVFLINKKRLLAILTQNYSEFKKEIPQINSPEHLLTLILEDSNFLRDITDRYEALLGIILGYGKDSAILHERKWELDSFLTPQEWKNQYRQRYAKKPFLKPIPKENFKTIEEEYAVLQSKEDGVIEKTDGLSVGILMHLPIGYLVDRTKTDLSQLRAKYKEEQRIATEAYRNGTFLEVTLRTLIL